MLYWQTKVFNCIRIIRDTQYHHARFIRHNSYKYHIVFYTGGTYGLDHHKIFGSRTIHPKMARLAHQFCGLVPVDQFHPDILFKLMCPYFILLIYTDGERDGLWMACPFRTLVVLYRMFPFIICLILMNYLMEFYFIGFVNAHLPGCFCPWTFRLNIGLNTSPSDSFVSYLNSHLGYSAGEFQALQLIVLAVFGAVD